MGKGKVTVGPYQAVDREGVRVLDQREDGVLARAQEDRRHVVVLATAALSAMVPFGRVPGGLAEEGVGLVDHPSDVLTLGDLIALHLSSEPEVPAPHISYTSYVSM